MRTAFGLSSPRRSRGFMLIDAVFAISVIGVLIVILGMVLTRAQRAETAFAERRSANRRAEGALCELQAGRAAPTFEGNGLAIHDLSATTAPVGYHWVQVEARVGKHQAVLSGIAPAAKGGQ